MRQPSKAGDATSHRLSSEASNDSPPGQAPGASSQNGPHSRARTLSPEIWCLVWSMLPRHERIPISHVCSYWRTVALGAACLWSHVTFNTIVIDARSPTRFKDCPCWNDPARSHDLSQLMELLHRSKGAEITVKLAVHSSCASDLLARDLAAAIQPHSHRLKSLKYTCGGADFLSKFLSRIQSFPSLASLRYGSKMLLDWCSPPRWPLNSLRLARLSLPRLSELVIPDLFVCDAFELLDLPQLRILRCYIDDAQTLLSILSRLPGLVTLEAGILESDDAPEVPSSAAFDGLAPLLDAITFQNVTLVWEPVLALLLRRRALKSVTLVYADPEESDCVSLGDLFAPLGHDLRLEMGFSSGFSVEASDSLGTRRSVTLPQDIMPLPCTSLLRSAWKLLPVDTLRSLTLEWCHRDGLLYSSITAPRLERLCLLVPSLPEWVQDPPPDSHPCEDFLPSRRPGFPQLRHVVVAAEDGRPRCIVSRALIRSFTSAISDSTVSVELRGVEVVP